MPCSYDVVLMERIINISNWNTLTTVNFVVVLPQFYIFSDFTKIQSNTISFYGFVTFAYYI